MSPRTRDILASTSGGPVFYHVYVPGRVIVAGCATPPVGLPGPASEAAEPTSFEAICPGRSVSGVRLQNCTEVNALAGLFTTTVWQESYVRAGFVCDLVLVAISSPVFALALIVWFGVRFGLRPLPDPEEAIAQRSGSDLSPIRLAVPEDVTGIAARPNGLLVQVSRATEVQSEFIANEVHQLRNPIA